MSLRPRGTGLREGPKIGGRLIVARPVRRNEGKQWSPATRRGGRPAAKHGPASAASDWVWGWHATLAALANPQRGAPLRLVATAERAKELAARSPALPAAE